jgi:toxin-antitoxin system PIN domain toxin
VIAVDTQILVYAHRAEAKHHRAAKAAIRTLAEGRDPWGLPSQVLHEFFGIVTHPRRYDPPSTVDEAWAQIAAWLESPSVVVLGEAERHLEILERLTRAHDVTGPRIHDARIAAICIDHGVRELWSADRDFARFTELRVTNPFSP